MSALIQGAARHAHDVAEAGRVPIVMTIGADIFGNSAPWTDVDLYAHVVPLLPKTFRLVLVEPMVNKLHRIRENLKRLETASGLDISGVQIITKAIDDLCPPSKSFMYRFSAQAQKDFGIDSDVSGGWTSFDELHPQLRAWGLAVDVGAGPSQRGAMKLALAANWSSYREKVPVECLTPEQLLAEVNATPADVSMVTVDADNDYDIAKGFFELVGFRPGFMTIGAQADKGLEAA